MILFADLIRGEDWGSPSPTFRDRNQSVYWPVKAMNFNARFRIAVN